MHFPRLPDWLIYVAAVLALVIAAVGRQERADAPEAPPPVPEDSAAALSGFSPFEAARLVPLPRRTATRSGTAFSVSEAGVWLTAAHVLKTCRQAAVVVAEGRGVEARVTLDTARDIAVLQTQGGAPALPLGAADAIHPGEMGFHPGFPDARPGEIASRLLGPGRMASQGRHGPGRAVTAWTEVGRTQGLAGPLDGLSGAPVLDGAGQVIGMTLAQAPRRGRIYAASPQALRDALSAAGVKASVTPRGETITVDNYGRVADGLRRDLRVARVVCLGD